MKKIFILLLSLLLFFVVIYKISPPSTMASNENTTNLIADLNKQIKDLKTDIDILEETNSTLQSDIAILREHINKGLVTNLSELPIASADSPDIVNITEFDGTSKTYLKRTKYNTDLTDLTNSIWTFHEVPSFGMEWNFVIDYISNNISCGAIHFYNQQGRREINYTHSNGWFTAFYDAWTGADTRWNGDYRTIEITGGPDATNSTLIEILKTNATLQNPILQYVYVEISVI